MIQTLILPSPTSPMEHRADWLELRTLQVGARGISLREIIRDFKIGGVIDSTDEWEEGIDTGLDEDDLSEVIAEEIFAEIHDRQLASGEAYPFELTGEHIRLREELETSIYIFLMLLSKYGKDAGPSGSNGAKLFEDVCARALGNYLGGEHPHVSTFAFGFPRRTLPKDFRPALDEMCLLMGEGIGSRGDQPKTRTQKDAKLDIVAWRDFADKRQGKLIAFGQCATGADWTEKRSELPDPGKWCQLWMHRVPHVHPIRVFFVPHRVERDEWELTCTLGGILFDRCRITYHAGNFDHTSTNDSALWAEYVLREMRN